MTNTPFTLVCGERVKGRHATLEAAIAQAGRIWPECLVEADPDDRLADSHVSVYAMDGHAPTVIPTAAILIETPALLAVPAATKRPRYALVPKVRGARPKFYATLVAAIDGAKRDWPGCRIEIGGIGMTRGGCLISVLRPSAHWSEAWGVVAHIRATGTRRPGKLADGRHN